MAEIDKVKLLSLVDCTENNKWADFVEIYCFFHENKSVSLEQIYDLASDKKKTEEPKKDAEDNAVLIDGIDTPGFGTNEPIRDDRLFERCRRRFNFLLSRIEVYEDHYPFIYDVENRIFKLKENFGEYNKIKLYLLLLFSSNLDVFKTDIPFLTREFERISYIFLAEYLNPSFEQFYFGATIPDIETKFKGSLFAKFKQLESHLQIPLTANVTEKYVGKQNSGDNGLDILATYKFNDMASGTLMYFIQCACGENWIEKQLEAHTVRWEAIFQFKNKPNTFVFIPRSYRDEVGNWYNPLKMLDAIIIDRLRIVDCAVNVNYDFLDKYADFFENINTIVITYHE
jgi:hypothetical protein